MSSGLLSSSLGPAFPCHSLCSRPPPPQQAFVTDGGIRSCITTIDKIKISCRDTAAKDYIINLTSHAFALHHSLRTRNIPDSGVYTTVTMVFLLLWFLLPCAQACDVIL
ncbi:hypothetical protein PBY51_017409 [Eleginops maclovinus]|uniref:Uncharacterized protein n=1 Tax=Eleginops maclovinus TaxID=56733 RepID=A0AAN8AMR3_ELEMC|nr:hypothetical protein PBY51_017409 [Eleginops maclovinus]